MTCQAHALAASRRMLHSADVDLIRELPLDPAAKVADVGCGSGTVALALLEERHWIKVWSVDVVDENVHRWTRAVLENTGVPVEACWTGIAGDAVTAAAAFEDGYFDAAVLDVGHDYEDAVAELAAWLPKVKAGGLVVKHDYDPVEEAPEVYPGVKLAVDEAVERGEMEIVERRGWSVLCQRTVPSAFESRRVELPTPTEAEVAAAAGAELESPEAHETSRRLNAEDDAAADTAQKPTESAPPKAAPKPRRSGQRSRRHS